jgi:hypothetical protein
MVSGSELIVCLGTLRKWYPNVWDRVMAEDPLDPPEMAEASFADCGTTGSTSSLSVTSAIIEPVQLTWKVSYASGTGTSTTVFPPTSTQSSNVQDFHPTGPDWPLTPRNRHERRIIAALGKRFPEVLRQVEKAFGPRSQAKSRDEWDNRFWAFVTRPPKPLDRCGSK